MRIVGGRHRGRKLDAPTGQAIRPTSDRARQALFNILEHGDFAATGTPFVGQRVLDVFAGSGALGLEALSRGAAHATFVEWRPQLLAANIAKLGETAHSTVLAVDARRLPTTRQPVAVAFLDPPYAEGLARPILVALAAGGWLVPGGLAALEIGARDPFELPPGFALLDQRRYGIACLLFLKFTGELG